MSLQTSAARWVGGGAAGVRKVGLAIGLSIGRSIRLSIRLSIGLSVSLAAALLSGALVTGCGAKVKPPVFEEDDPRAARQAALAEDGEAAAPAATPAIAPGDPAAAEAGKAAPLALPPRPLAPPGTQPRTGTIDRGALLGVLDQGPGGFLRGVEISPFFEGTRFLGWRLDQIVDRASPLYGADLALGDVVLAINRRPLARPEHVMSLWQELRGADELVAQVWRGAGAFELRFAITPKAAPSSAPSSAPVPQRPPVTTTAAPTSPTKR